MMEQIEYMGELIPFCIVRSRRNSISIALKSADEIVVRAPLRISEQEIYRIVEEKADWIMKKQRELKARAAKSEAWISLGEEEKRSFRTLASNRIPERIDFYAKGMKAEFNQVRIKDQKSRWGSCSAKRNLNFNWRLVMTPDYVMDYVIVHELCHLTYMNHSADFWKYVEAVMPDYKRAKLWLRENGEELMAK